MKITLNINRNKTNLHIKQYISLFITAIRFYIKLQKSSRDLFRPDNENIKQSVQCFQKNKI